MENRLLVDLQGTYARPLGGTSQRFIIDGELGGPTKYPSLLARAAVSFSPLQRLRLSVDGSFSTKVKQTIATEVQFDLVPATDGEAHTTLPAQTFDTREIPLNASASYGVTSRLRLEIGGTNLLNRRAYRPGSVLIPYLAEGRRLTLGLTYDF